MDGKIIHENLSQNGYDPQWLRSQVEKKGLALEEINYAVQSTNGRLFFDTYKDGLSNPIDKE